MVDITGDNAANVLFGSLGSDLIKGKSGDDYINGRDGDDKLKAGNGKDTVVDGAGVDRMWGGNDADLFVLSADGDKDFIRDWQSIDTIDLTAWGVTDIADLTFTNLSNGQVRIAYGDEVLQIKGKGGAALTDTDFSASDFVFAPTGPQTIDFEDLELIGPQFGAPIELMKPGYGGLTWSEQFYFVEEPDLDALGRTAGNGSRTGGGDIFATNGFGGDVHFSSLDPADNFDFQSAQIGAVYNDGMTIRISGLDDGNLVATQFVTVDTAGSLNLALSSDFDSVDQVVFTSSGGTLNSAYAGIVGGSPDTTHFYIDDIAIA
ncbi:MAG: hypothetical protein AAGB15_00820 [Pseudomonadota bacterium]